MSTMQPSIDALIADLGSPDFNQRAKALAELTRRGREAVPALLPLLDTPDTALRFQATRALSAIADPACADAFARLLHDPDERIRAHAAQGLARVRDARALDALVGAIDDYPDVLREPFTPAVDELIAYGRAALPAVAPLLDAPNRMTRVRAFLVIREVLSAQKDADWQALSNQLGNYDPSADGPQREKAARLWQDWIAQHVPAH
ncbi:MAG: HEAT repeat domain-containing protein [Burkholderiales bacterium]